MRVYFEKPRTTVGWKGLINDPHLNNSFKNQFRELKKLNAESLSLAFIKATINTEDTHGYHTSPAVAKSLLSNNEFTVVVYSPEGNEIIKSTTVITSSKITELINKHNKALLSESLAALALRKARR